MCAQLNYRCYNRTIPNRREQMRNDGRRRDGLRPMKLEPGSTRYAEGSVPVTQGRTVVLRNATVEDRLPSWMSRGVGGEEAERGWVTAEAEPFDRAMLSRLLDVASGGIGGLLRAQLAALEECAARYPTKPACSARSSICAASSGPLLSHPGIPRRVRSCPTKRPCSKKCSK